jgi:simple sugar transport system permease protein
LFAYFTAVLATAQVITGLASNLIALGLATFAYRAAFGIPLFEPKAPIFYPAPIPVLSSIPFVGEVLFTQHAWTYLAWLLVPLCYLVMFKTPWGLNVTASGENPYAPEAAGVGVARTRFMAVVVGGALAGLGGMVLPLSGLGYFKEEMVAGRGFIAVAIVMLGRWNPYGVLAAALMFGMADSLQLRLQSAGLDAYIPSHFLVALPYVLTVIVVGVSHRMNLGPAAFVVPFRGSEER